MYKKIKQDKDKVKHYINKMQELQTERQQWQAQWDDLSQYVLPRKNRVYGQPIKNGNRGEEKYNKLYDSTSIQANELLASAMHSMLTSPVSKWFSLTSGDPEVDMNYDVQLWLEDTRDRILGVLNQSNFNTQAHENYLDIGCIGTSTLAMEEDKDDVVTFMARPVYDVLIDENHKKQVDTIYITWTMSYKQIVQKWR